MSVERNPTRALLAYCALAERLTSPGASPVTALVPFLAPICANRAGELFEAKKFASDVAARYGLHLPKLAALALTDALASEGMLEAIVPGSRSPAYKYSINRTSHNTPGADGVSEGQIDALLGRFIQTCRKDERLSSLKDEQLEEGFLSRLVNADSMRILSRKEGYSELKRTPKTLTAAPLDVFPNDETRTEYHLDFAVSHFLLDLANSDPTSFEIASNVAFASMAAEAIACFQEPISTEDLHALTVVLDSPLLLDMLGVNSEYEEYGQELLTVLKECGATVVAFDHSINEAESAVHAQLEYLRSGVNKAGNSVSTSVRPDLLAALDNNVASRCEARLGLTIVRDPSTNLHKRQTAAVGNVQSMMDERMKGWGHQEAKDYDQKTIWHFLALRESSTLIGRICDAQWIFVSRNTALVAIANDAWRMWLRDTTRHSETKIALAAPVALSDKQFAGYAWLRRGGKVGEIPKKRLLAHCSAAVRPRADIKARAYNLFLTVHGKDQADDLIVLMEDREGSRALMQATHGDPLDVSSERLPLILEQVKLAAGEYAASKARDEAKQEIEKLEDRHAEEMRLAALKASEAQSALDEASRRAALDAAQAAEDHAATRNQLRQVQRSVGDQQRRTIEGELKQLRDAFARGAKHYKGVRWLIVALSTLLSALGAITATDNPTLSIAIPTIAFALSFWFVPNYLSGICEWAGLREIRRQLQSANLDTDVRREDLDFETAKWTVIDEKREALDKALSGDREPEDVDASHASSRVVASARTY